MTGSTSGPDQLDSQASSGALWTILGHGGTQLVRLASNLIVTRLLLAEHFGLMALVNVFLVGLHLFSDIGIGPALIQNRREDPDFVNTVWTIQVVRGISLCLLAMPIAGLYADFYHEPILAPLVRVVALTAAIEGFTSTSIFTETRHLRLKGPILLDLGAQVTGTISMVVTAWFTRSIWSLVVAGLVTSVLTVALSHFWLPGIRNRFRFDRRAAHSLFVFGSWIFIGTVAMFASDQLDRLFFGRITTMATLGVYSIAAMLAVVPTYAISELSRSVLFPLYSRVHYSSRDLSEVYLSARWPLLVLGGWFTTGLVAGGPTIIRLLYDSRYWEAGWMLQILAAGLWAGMVLGGTAASVVLAAGRSEWTAAMAFAKVVGLAAFIPIGYSLAGFPGAVAGLSTAELLRYAVAEFAAVKFGFDGRRQDLIFTVRVAVAALVTIAVVRWLTDLGVTHVVLQALVVFVVATAFWIGPIWVLFGRVRRKESLFIVDVQLPQETA